MDYLFLYLDEELTNHASDRDYLPYSAQEIALWLQFYSLFCDRLYVPADFLLDSNVSSEVLSLLRASSKSSTLHGERGDVPFRILWDKSRLTGDTFADALDEIERRTSYVTRREWGPCEGNRADLRWCATLSACFLQ
jgi:hypothetical protein